MSKKKKNTERGRRGSAVGGASGLLRRLLRGAPACRNSSASRVSCRDRGGELRALHVYMCVLARVFTCNEHSGLMSRLWAQAGGGGGGGGGAEGSVGLRVASKDDQSRFRYSPPCINHGGAREAAAAAAESKGGGGGGGGGGAAGGGLVRRGNQSFLCISEAYTSLVAQPSS